VIAKFRTHTDAVVAKLVAAGRVVGDADEPSAAHGWQGAVGQSAFISYTIVYPLIGGVFDGSLGEPDDDASLIWQLTCVGASRQQAEFEADASLAALVGQSLTVADRSISRVWADLAAGGARRDDTGAGQPLFLSTPRIRVESYPA
jgi:hypothetical protein